MDMELPCGTVQKQFKKLVENVGRTVQYTDLAARYQSYQPGTLPRNISTIRKALQQLKVPFEITTLQGDGYRLSSNRVSSAPKNN